MKKAGKIPAVIAMILLSLFTFPVSFAQDVTKDDPKGLKDYYGSYFTMGVAVSPMSLQGAQEQLIKKHFASITAENVMKPAPIHPAENKYSFESADRIAEFAKANGMKLRGHTLLWHQQSPAWFFRDENGNPASKELALARLKEHITTVVGRYKGVVYAWDVVNEAISDDKDEFFRETDWYKTCGSEYIAKAFQWAHEADPDAELYYNDYNTENPVKREKIIKLLTGLKEVGVPVHGVGLQGHWSIYHPSEQELRESIESYAKLGLKIQVTELDVSVYPSSHKNPDDDVFTPEMEQKQIEQYKMIFRVLRDYKDIITAVTFWNVSDQRSWLDNFPVRGRKNYPLLFDQNNQPKKAYRQVINF